MIARTLFAGALSLALTFSTGLAFAQDMGGDDGDPQGTQEREKPAEKADGGTELDTAEVLAAMKKAHAAINDLSCKAVSLTPMGPMNQKADETFSFKRAGHFKGTVSQANPMTGQRQDIEYYSQGKGMTVFVKSRNAYVEMPEDKAEPAGNASKFLYKLLADAEELHKNLAKAKATSSTVDGVEIVTLNAKGYTQTMPMLGEVKADLIIEMTKDGYAPRKITMDVDLDSNPMFKQMKAQLEAMGMKGLKTTMTFSDVKVNTGLKADAFGFTPPEGAQKMDPNAMGGGMGGRGRRPRNPGPAPKPADPKPSDEDPDEEDF